MFSTINWYIVASSLVYAPLTWASKFTKDPPYNATCSRGIIYPEYLSKLVSSRSE
jgi:hypothetical protein